DVCGNARVDDGLQAGVVHRAVSAHGDATVVSIGEAVGDVALIAAGDDEAVAGGGGWIAAVEGDAGGRVRNDIAAGQDDVERVIAGEAIERKAAQSGEGRGPDRDGAAAGIEGNNGVAAAVERNGEDVVAGRAFQDRVRRIDDCQNDVLVVQTALVSDLERVAAGREHRTFR